jgi:Tfp pilus assembly protein PilO
MKQQTKKHAHGRRLIAKTVDDGRPSFGARLGKVGTSFLNWGERKGRRKVFLLSLLLAGGLAYGGYTMFVEPVKAENQSAAEANQRLHDENEKNRTVEKTHDAFQAEFKRDVINYRTARQLLPNNIEVTNVLGQVQVAAVQSGGTLTGFDAITKTDVKSPAADKLYEREVPAVYVGTYPQAIQFFRAVARLPRIVQIRDFALTSLRQKVSVSFKLIVYYAPPPNELPPLPPELKALLDDDNQTAAIPASTNQQPMPTR